MKFPSTRLVAFNTATAAPRTGSSSARQAPRSFLGPSPFLTLTDTMTTVASNARTDLTPTSSNSSELSEKVSIARRAASAATRRSTVALDWPAEVPRTRMPSIHSSSTSALHLPPGVRRNLKSVNFRRSRLRSPGVMMRGSGVAPGCDEEYIRGGPLRSGVPVEDYPSETRSKEVKATPGLKTILIFPMVPPRVADCKHFFVREPREVRVSNRRRDRFPAAETPVRKV